MAQSQSKNGLSKTTTLHHDIAKPGAVKLGNKPNIGQNHKGLALSGGATHDSPGGKLGSKSLPKGWKK